MTVDQVIALLNERWYRMTGRARLEVTDFERIPDGEAA